VRASIKQGKASGPGGFSSGTLAVPRWDLAFLGTLGYMFIEYTRLAAMYPWLQPLQVGKVAVGAGALGLILSPGGRGSTATGSRSVDVALVCFFFASVLSACFADYPQLAWDQVFDTFQWCVIYFLISRSVNNSWRMRFLIFVYLLLNFKLAQFGIRGYFADSGYGRSAEFIAGHGEGAGSTGFFGNQGDFGVAMCVVWPVAGSLFMGEKKKFSKYFLAVCFLVFLGAIVVCGSRGAILAAGVVALASFLKNPKRIASVLMVLIFGLAFIYLVPDATKNRMQSALHPETDETATIRLNLWRAGLNMFEDHPVLGVGPANFPREYLSYHPASDRQPMMWVPHSIYIEGLAELGIAGFASLVALWWLLFRVNARTRKALRQLGQEATRSFEYRLAMGLDLALVGYMVSGAFITVLYYPHLWVLLGLCAGLHTSCLKRLTHGNEAAVPVNTEIAHWPGRRP
jgi:putative inorganic carbon (hco3(-)) transporter